MIDRGAAFGNSAISVTLSMLVACLFYYAFYIKRYRSGSKGTVAKIRLLLGAVSAIFILLGAGMILQELTYTKWAGISVNEDKIYGGLLLIIPVVLVVSVVTWIVGFFDSSGSGSAEISGSSSISPKPTVDQQVFKSDLIVYALIAASIILVVVVPNWSEVSGILNSKRHEAQPTGTISSPKSTTNPSPSTITDNSTSVVESPQVCMFMWVADRAEFVKITSDLVDRTLYTNKFIPKTSSAFYVDDLMRQLRAADAANQDVLAREIAKEIRRHSLTIYYDVNLSGALIHSLAKSRNLESKC